ncbi:MAG: hypothetical protein KDC83_08810 [Flavobacteriales bacterium]|nr:hypothetical protein [Flavobacteriales bacterium]
MKIKLWISIVLVLLCFSFTPYPIDGYEVSGIKRLKYVQLVQQGTIKGTMPITGAQKSIKDIKLQLVGRNISGIPTADAELQKSLNSLFPSLHESYSIAVLDISLGKPVRYASRKETGQYQPGSVGKLAVAFGLFEELKKIYPDSYKKRQDLLRTKIVRAGKWALTDGHTVPFFDLETQKLSKRAVAEPDEFSLFEWLDHMISVSNNGAASIVWREAILMRAFGKSYPMLTEEKATEYFKNTPKSQLSELAIDVVNTPMRNMGITEDEWRLGTLFTKGAGSYIPPKGGSTGSPLGVMKFLIALESGKIVDKESSLEIKRLMYQTDRRIRYATAPALASAAVYFKSGSLYKCQPEEGYTCAKYKGNVRNFMNSVAIVEHTDGATYMVVLMSNVLYKNSANDHQALASSIDRIIRK